MPISMPISMNDAIINFNGQIVSPDEARVSVFDRAFLYGDSLYEVVRSRGGKAFRLEEHLKRLRESARLALMELGQPLEEYGRAIEDTIAALRKQDPRSDTYCRLIVSRGVGAIGFGRKSIKTPTQYWIIVRPLTPITPALFERGLKVKISSRIRNDRRALDPAMKSGNYLNNILAFIEAEDEGYDDSILCDAAGDITEATTSNFFIVKKGIPITAPLEIGILDGITRRDVIDAGKQAGITMREARFSREDVFAAEEAFITSTLKDVFPVTAVNGRIIGDGKPGPITIKLLEAYLTSIGKTKK